MKQATIYQYSKCGTCRDAVKHLKRNGYELESIEIFDNPPDAKTLAGIVRKSGLPLQRFFNTSGEVYREQQLKDRLPGMTEEEKIALLSSNGRLIKRPIVVSGDQVTVGYKAQQYDEIWS